MRVVGCLALLAGCGRLDFNATLDGAPPDGTSDTPGAACVATLVPFTLAASGPVMDVIGTKMPNGYALGFLHESGSVLNGVVLDSTLTPNTLNPFRTSPAVGTNITYSHASLFWDGTNLDGSTTVIEDGYCYYKTFQPDMSAYVVADGRMNCFTGEPSVAISGTTPVGTYYMGSAHTYSALDNTGMPTGDMTAGVSSGMIVSTSIASGDPTAALVSSSDNQTCDLRTIPFTSSTGVPAPPCANPRIYPGDTPDAFFLVYESGSDVVFRNLRYAGSLIVGPPTVLGAGSRPKFFTVNGEHLVAYRSGNALAIKTTTGEDKAIAGLPGLDAFEPVGPHIFATFGADLFGLECQ